MEDLERNLGRRVATLRHVTGLTQMQLAESADTTLDTISRLERGASMPGVRRLASVAKALNVPLWQVFQEDTPTPESAVILAALGTILAECDGETAQIILDVAIRIARRR